MAAGRLYIPQHMPAFDSNGDPIPGAQLYFYENQTTVAQTTYTTSALSVANSHPVVADAAGIFPPIWADDALTFTVVVTDADGAPLASFDGVTPSTSMSSAAVALADAAADRAEEAADDAEASALLAEAAAAEITGAPFQATSTTSLSVGTGSKSLTLAQTGKLFVIGQSVVIARTSAPGTQMTGVITAFTSSTGAMTVEVAATAGAGTHTDWTIGLSSVGGVASVAGETGIVTADELATALALVSTDLTDFPSAFSGRQSLYIAASAMLQRTTNGAAAGLAETASNRIMLSTLDFDASTIEYAQFSIRMPKSWDEGTVTFVPEWSHGATATNFGVSWGLQGVALSNDDAADTAFGTAQYSNDTGGTTNDVYAGPESNAITIAGSPAAEDWVVFQVFRKADDATNDTLAVDAKLLGLTLYITTNAVTDA